MRILNQMALLLERKLLSFPAAQQVDPRYLVLQTSWKTTALPPRKRLFMGKMGKWRARVGHLKSEEGFRGAFRGVIDIDIYIYILYM